jgi:hypothetical protein
MTATELANLSMSELKSICVDRLGGALRVRAISVIGDRRLKANYISAIEGSDRHQEEIAAMPTIVIADPFDEPAELQISAPIPQGGGCANTIGQNEHCTIAKRDTKADVPSQLLSPHSHRNASTVLLVPLILALALFLAVKTTITSLAWSFAHLAPFITRLWRSLLEYWKPDRSIDYFPSLA